MLSIIKLKYSCNFHSIAEEEIKKIFCSSSIVDEYYPSCQRNCTELNPETAIQNCPALRRGLSCGKYMVYHYHRRCSVATVYCQRNMTNVKEVAVYVAVIGTDLNAK